MRDSGQSETKTSGEEVCEPTTGHTRSVQVSWSRAVAESLGSHREPQQVLGPRWTGSPPTHTHILAPSSTPSTAGPHHSGDTIVLTPRPGSVCHPKCLLLHATPHGCTASEPRGLIYVKGGAAVAPDRDSQGSYCVSRVEATGLIKRGDGPTAARALADQ